jgi:hypothetical protein
MPPAPGEKKRIEHDSSAGSNEEFQRLQQRLLLIWNAMHESDAFRTLLTFSLSVDQDELSKVQGASFYEERLLFALIRLRNPNARLIYVTSQPVHPDVVDYYLQLLVGVPAAHAKRRLQMLCLFDASPRALTEKVLERPRVLKRLREWIAEHGPAYLTCYNTTMLERRLALELNIPLNGVDPVLLPLGTKSGSRRTFAAAGVPYPAGFEDLHSEDEMSRRCVLAQQRPGIAAPCENQRFFSAKAMAFSATPRKAATARPYARLCNSWNGHPRVKTSVHFSINTILWVELLKK